MTDNNNVTMDINGNHIEQPRDGGPAFPMQPLPPTGPRPTNTGVPFSFPGITDVWTPGSPGMSMRDYFAAEALSVIIGLTSSEGEGWNAASAAQTAYNVADEMLEARKQ